MGVFDGEGSDLGEEEGGGIADEDVSGSVGVSC